MDHDVRMPYTKKLQEETDKVEGSRQWKRHKARKKIKRLARKMDNSPPSRRKYRTWRQEAIQRKMNEMLTVGMF